MSDTTAEAERLERLALARETVLGAATALSGNWSEPWLERLRDVAELLKEQDAHIDEMSGPFTEAIRGELTGIAAAADRDKVIRHLAYAHDGLLYMQRRKRPCPCQWCVEFRDKGGVAP